LNQYADALLSRFANSALPHRLIQIAMDGSQKIPQRWLETLAWHQERGHCCPAILKALAAWIIHIRGDSHVVDDPMAAQFAHFWRAAGRVGVTEKLFGMDGLFSSHWIADAQASGIIAKHLEEAEMKQEA
jgi:fructuronate reductase